MKKLLVQFAELTKARVAFVEQNKPVFDQLQNIDQAIAEVENEIKEIAKTTKQEVTEGSVIVKVTRAFKKWYDYALLSPKTLKLLEKEGGIKHEVNRDVFEQLVHDDKIDKAERAKAFQEEELTPRVSVKVVQEVTA